MLLTLAGSASYARAAESQADIGLATTLAMQIKLRGSDLLGVGASGGAFVILRSTTSASAVRVQSVAAQVGNDLYLGVIPANGQTNAIYAILPQASIDAGTDYVIYADAGPGGRLIELYTAAGTLVQAGSGGGVEVANAGAANGFVMIGASSGLGAVIAAYDGIAVYNARLSGAARYSPPDLDSPSLLWCVLDDSGQLVPGATELSEMSGASWEPGGEWDPPAPAPNYSGTLSAAAQPATASIAGAHAAPVPIGALAAAAGAALVAIAGAYSPPAGGALSAHAQAATSSISGAYEAPITGALSVAAGAATASLAGSFEYPEPRWAVLGDSNSEAYGGAPQRGAGTPYASVVLNWTELIARPQPGQARVPAYNRDIDLGTWGTWGEPRRTDFARNWARSGAVAQGVIDSQLPGVVSQIQAGDVTHVAIQTPQNDWHLLNNPVVAAIYDSPDGGVTTSTGVSVAGLVSAYVGRVQTCIDGVLDAGAVGVVVLTVSDPMAFPGIFGQYPNATRRGYVSAAIASVRSQLVAYVEAINTSAGRTVVVEETWDRGVNPEIFSTYSSADGGALEALGLTIGAWYAPDSNPYYMLQDAASPHQSTLINGITANAFIAAANQLPGVQIEPFTDREIRENAGIFADEVTGALAATAQPATAQIAGAHTAPVYAGAIAATADPASAQLTGAHTAPTYAGELSATAQAASSAITGAHTAPAYAGALGASAGAATASLSGTHAAPQEDGALRAAAQPATASIAGSYAAPVHVGQMVALAGSATAQIAGAYAVPAGGTLRAAAQRATAVVTGSYAAPGAVGTLAAAAQPATAQIAGTHSAPVWTGSVAAAAEQASAAIAGRYAAPGVIVGRLRAAAAPASAHIEAEYTYSGVVHPVRATLSVSSIRPTLTVMDA